MAGIAVSTLLYPVSRYDAHFHRGNQRDHPESQWLETTAVWIVVQQKKDRRMTLRMFAISAALGATLLLITGCATYRTISAVKYGDSSPRIYSGTSLNLYAISNNHSALSRLGVEPPACPMLDLPASFALDTFILPVTVSSVITERLRL